MVRKAHGLAPVSTRSRMILEVACELVAAKGFPYRQARLLLRGQGSVEWEVCLYASDNPSAIDEVESGKTAVAIINPANPLGVALKGAGPYKAPVAVRAIAVIPSLDQLAFAVTKSTGLKTLADVRDKRYPLRISLRGQMDHSIHWVIREALAVAGFSLDDIISWGGSVRYDRGLPDEPGRLDAVERGEIDAIWDEALEVWGNDALAMGMTFLQLDPPIAKGLEKIGLKLATIPKKEYPLLERDVLSLDFSGWTVFTHERVPDDLVYAFCAGIEARKDLILWDKPGPLPLHTMCRDTEEGPLNVPLHPAAERYWREHGYLD